MLIFFTIVASTMPISLADDGYTHPFTPTRLRTQDKAIKEWLSLEKNRTLFVLLQYYDIANSGFDGELDVDWTYNVFLCDVYGIGIATAYRLKDGLTLIASYSQYADCTYAFVADKKQSRAEYKAELEEAFKKQGTPFYEVTMAEIAQAESATKTQTEPVMNNTQAKPVTNSDERLAADTAGIIYTDTESVWTISNYIDEFKQPTDKLMVTTKKRVYGTFSNTSTTDSTLGADIIITKEVHESPVLEIILWEYGRLQVRNSYRDPSIYRTTIRYSDGTKQIISGNLNTDRVSFNADDSRTIFDALAKGSIMLFMEEMTITRATSTYLITLSSEGFVSAYNALLQSY